MATLKCKICGKEILTHDDKEQIIVCDDCKPALDELSDGKGADENE